MQEGAGAKMNPTTLLLRTAFGLGVGLSILTMAALIGPGKVWRMDYSGRALLKKAENERKVQIEDAKAKLESAKLHAKAEIERAKGVAEANQIIGSSLKGNESYLRYLWIQTLNNDSNDVIYIPTEGNLPILEAGQRKSK